MSETAPFSLQFQALQNKHAEQLQRTQALQEQLSAAQKVLGAIEAELVNLAQQQIAALSPNGDSQSADETSHNATLILNPAAKTFLNGGSTPEQVVAALVAVGIRPRLALTTPEIGAHQLALNAIRRGDTLIIAAGGDGTIEEIALALINQPASLGILPLGTMNNLARSLGIPTSLADSARLIATGIKRNLDVGRVLTPDNSLKGYFLETAGIGISAVAAPMGENAEKGRWSDVFSKLGQFLSFSSVGMKIYYQADADPIQTSSYLLTISNAPLFGNNMLIAPNAQCDDGWLDVAIYEGMELVDLTSYFFGISKGGRVNEPRVRFIRTKRLHVVSDAPLAINADLDVLDERKSWEIEVAPRALSVIVGNGSGLSLPVSAVPVTSQALGEQPEVAK